MSAAVALARLEAAGVTAWVDGDLLRLRGPQPSPALLMQARQHKAEIIHLLTAREMRAAAAEAAAMAEHYAAPTELAPPAPRPRDDLDEWLGLDSPASTDPLRDGLLRGYRAAHHCPQTCNPGEIT
ncbi:hypothetical protein [Roseomonas sp. BN140053]|uniref:hypothetical protein n=1 Tax=Roseomonas sp. BN140053 TaxID=3391898 RepID=UPI0039EB4CFA